MRRREFIAGLGSAAATGLASPVGAQPTDRVRRIAVLYGGSAAVDMSFFNTFRSRLEELGWKPERNISIELRWGEGSAQKMRDYAAELVAWSPELIFVFNNLALATIKPLAGRIPIVFAGVGDPVGSNFVSSLTQPGGNVTGFESFVSSMGGKWLEVLKEAAPHVTRAIAIFHPETTASQDSWRSIQEAAPRLGVEVMAGGVHNAAEIEAALSSFASKPNGGVIVLPHAVTVANHKFIVGLELKHRLPSVHPAYEDSLVTYGLDWNDEMRRAAGYVDRVLRGTNPGDLPVQAPIKFELIINLKFARAIGLDVPATMLAHADKVIE
jgi:putative tryptophan/tyrosine transport system substrate-binding protein